MRLRDKVAIITGGAHGMGEAEVRLFAAEGAKVLGVSRTQANLDETLAQVKAAEAAIETAKEVQHESS